MTIIALIAGTDMVGSFGCGVYTAAGGVAADTIIGRSGKNTAEMTGFAIHTFMRTGEWKTGFKMTKFIDFCGSKYANTAQQNCQFYN